MRPKRETLKAVAPKINPGPAEWFAANFRTLNSGITFTLNSFPAIYGATLAELKGQFSAGELSMILDVLNGTVLTAVGSEGLIGQHVTLSVADSFLLYPGCFEDKWNIADKNDFLERLNGLPRFSRVCLEIWASIFWEKKPSDDIEEINKYVGRLAH